MAAAPTGKLSKKRVVKRNMSALKPSTVALYASIFMVVVALVAAGYRSPQSSSVASVNLAPTDSKTSAQQTSVNEVVATTIAADVAESANLSVAANVANLSVSLAAESEMTTASRTESVSKQQIIHPTGDRRTLITYTVKSGDTVESVAAEYGVSEDTIKWANNLTSNNLSKGKKLTIPPVDGVVHKVNSGDTPAKLASKYKTSEQRIVAFNNLELTGLKNGSKIIIPAGKMPEPTPTPTPSVGSGYNSGTNAGAINWMPRGSTAGNGYAYGYCTWYVKDVRPDLPNQLGNANTWYQRASAMGLSVGSEPRAGAVFQTSLGGGGYGHVGIIDSVDHEKGTVTYSDMNGIAGWNAVGRATISISQAKSQWNFIY